MQQQAERVVIGVDSNKRSVTIEVTGARNTNENHDALQALASTPSTSRGLRQLTALRLKDVRVPRSS